MAKQKSTGWLDKFNENKVAQADATRTKNTKNIGIKKGPDQPIGNMLDITLGAPQRQAVKMITGKEQSPSEAMGIKNPWGAFAADAILDPTNLVGVGLMDDAVKGGLGFNKLVSNTGEAISNINKRYKAPAHLNVVRNSMDPSALFKKNTDKFASEINWGNWNKEIPNNVPLMQEYNAIEKTAKANGSWMRNADGSAFQGTPEQFVQQNSQNFKKAFGNTKFKDEKGNPMILHHGHFTDRDFSSFMPSEMSGISNSGYEGNYSFFTPHKSLAEDYAGIGQGLEDVQGYNSYVKSVYLNSEKPLIDPRTEFADRDIPKSLREGRDAITRSLDPKEFSEVAVPYGNNVKSATGNNGMFDLTKRNIYKSIAPIVGAGAAASQFVDQKKNGGWLEKFDDGGPVQPNYNDYSVSASPDFVGDGYSNRGRNYSPAWGGQFAMGGSMPGSVGFTYARTNDPAPSNGPYAKKTLASAQNGTEMRYYQEGLDFKPKSISRDGSQLKKLDQLTNFTNYNPTQPSGWLEKYQ